MIKILLVFGIRSEAIKMIPLVLAFQKDSQDIELKVCVSRLHREMLGQIFHIVPDYNLNTIQPRQDLYNVTSGILLGMKKVLTVYQPDVLFVNHDTTRSIARAINTFYKNVLAPDVKAGIGTGEIYSLCLRESASQMIKNISNKIGV